MALKKLGCSSPIFQCNKDQMRLPHLYACVISGAIVSYLETVPSFFSTSLHIYLMLCTVTWDSFLYFKMTEK